jgi:hypothetical protein
VFEHDRLSVTQPRDAAAEHAHLAFATAGFVVPTTALRRGSDFGLRSG